MPRVVWMQSVRAEALPQNRDAGLNSADGKQVQHRHRVVPSDHFYYLHIGAQRGDVPLLAPVASGVVLPQAVQRCHYHNGSRRIFLNQFFQQQMACAIKSMYSTIRKAPDRRISMAKVIGSSKHHNHIRLGVHSGHTRNKILIGIRGLSMKLGGNSGSPDPVVACRSQPGLLPQDIQKYCFLAGNRHALCDAVTQKINCFISQIQKTISHCYYNRQEKYCKLVFWDGAVDGGRAPQRMNRSMASSSDSMACLSPDCTASIIQFSI
ncbi:hypothetical protein SDC9_65612 [bioreactor metagenome]|uniref:Uncharacterized protein n=1 Tax=bioreactor metagenome TaxID=1076179 RepID=A0A644XYU0_9ZZZZ